MPDADFPSSEETSEENEGEEAVRRDFLRTIIAADVANQKNGGRVQTRFPPEPNGYPHIGHAKAICINFEIAREFGGKCNLRFDDTNPEAEDVEYVDAIEEDIRWLGYDWGDTLFASDYFGQLYEWAQQLVRQGDAYVDDQSIDEIRAGRGSRTEPGVDSPFRNRSVDENLGLLEKMRQGDLPEGSAVLRAKIDMKHDNLGMRDPVMYRIRHVAHHRTGDVWKIYATYDWAHGQSDSIESITHSLCSLEFVNHRPLYDWFLDKLGVHHPQQIEFARLNVTNTVTSKRKLRKLVDDGLLAGWDDVATVNSEHEMALLEHTVREDLNPVVERRLAVLRPLELIITNWPEGQVDQLEAVNNPEDPDAGKRTIPFAGRLFVEQDDFREEAPKKWFRLAPGREVRLRWGYFVTVDDLVKDDVGNVVQLRCTYDPETRGGQSPDGRRVKGTIHWVSTDHAVDAEVRLYDKLLLDADEQAGDDKPALNPASLEVLTGCKLEPDLATASAGDRFQFERSGYYCVDLDSSSDGLVFNRTVSLRDSWAKIEKKGK